MSDPGDELFDHADYPPDFGKGGPGEIDQNQMRKDFEAMPGPADGPMRRARRIVEDHIAAYGMVPHPDKMKEAIACEIGLAEIRMRMHAGAAVTPKDTTECQRCHKQAKDTIWSGERTVCWDCAREIGFEDLSASGGIVGAP